MCPSIFSINYERKEGMEGELTQSTQQHDPDNDLNKNTTKKRKMLTNLLRNTDGKILNNIAATRVKKSLGKSYQVGFIPRMQRKFNTYKSMNML